jgi:hypothetical protein
MVWLAGLCGEFGVNLPEFSAPRVQRRRLSGLLNPDVGRAVFF